jgi:hypothetical protein
MTSRIKLAALGSAVLLCFAPLALAQTSPLQPSAPAATTPAVPKPAQTPAASVSPAATPGVAAQSAPPANGQSAEAACRTRKEQGEQCSCLSAPTSFGTAQASNDGGRNVCRVPQS